MDGRRVVVAGVVNKALFFSRHLLPDIAQTKLNEELYELISADEQKFKRGDKEKAAAEAG